jgi:aspartyl-tRNA(Asn)/glutamyl-tRNA(Gln) amidotransferase subunit B
MRSAEEAGAYLRKLRSILRHLGTCDGNMEEGSLRCDANVSVRRPNGPLGTRCEIKNVNSIKFLMQAIEYEARRQIEVIEGGGRITQETRLFDSGQGITRSMRSKEYAHDYRYFPDPDLLPLTLQADWVEKIRESLPELPDEKKARFVAEYGIPVYDAGVLVAEKATAAYFEAAVAAVPKAEAKTAANWVIGELFAALNRTSKAIGDSPVPAPALGGLVRLIADGTISGRIAKEVFEIMFETGKDAAAIVEEQGLRQVSDEGAIDAAVVQVLEANADKVAEYKAGKEKLFGFFVGQVMKATGGKANPALVNQVLKRRLAG